MGQQLLVALIVLAAAVFAVLRLLPARTRVRVEGWLLARPLARAVLPARLRARWAQGLSRRAQAPGCGGCGAAPGHRTIGSKD